MLIVGQENNIVVNLRNVTEIKILSVPAEKQYRIVTYFSNKAIENLSYLEIGMYDSFEQAVKVLEDLTSAYRTSEAQGVYQMPAPEEVEDIIKRR